VRYVLPELTDEDVQTLYRIMMDEAYITRCDRETLTFSEAFYKYNFRSESPGLPQ
jgi:hypothetical protein